MRINDDQFGAFVRAMQKTLTASIRIEKVDVQNFRCIVSLHNPTDQDFDFLYVEDEMNRCDFLTPFDKEGNPLQEVVEFKGEFMFTLHKQLAHLQGSKNWQVVPVTAGGVQHFEIPIWQEERAVNGMVKLLHIGEMEMFWIGEATRIDLLFGYYRLESEFVPLPLDL